MARRGAARGKAGQGGHPLHGSPLSFVVVNAAIAFMASVHRNAATFDDIEVLRPRLAKSYLELLEAQPGRPLAMFAPRRVGKTFFLDHDLAPAARPPARCRNRRDHSAMVA